MTVGAMSVKRNSSAAAVTIPIFLDFVITFLFSNFLFTFFGSDL